MMRGFKLEPSLWPAILLTGFVFCGGAASIAVQMRQSREQLRTAAAEATGGDVVRGKAVFRSADCGACHQVFGVDGADGGAGPPLSRVGTQAFIAGVLPNSPANLIHWVQHPQAVLPGSGMPDPDLNDQQARDVAAYLYTLK
jgi:cytochrome c